MIYMTRFSLLTFLQAYSFKYNHITLLQAEEFKSYTNIEITITSIISINIVSVAALSSLFFMIILSILKDLLINDKYLMCDDIVGGGNSP